MTQDHKERGGAPLAVLNRMDAWEANLVLNLRLWCSGTDGQSQVWNEYRRAWPGNHAQTACRHFEVLLSTLIDTAYRPLVRHNVDCSCVGADECVFVHLVRLASDGHLHDAALVATLIAGPSRAEEIALLAGEVGTHARKLNYRPNAVTPNCGSNVIRLH